MLRLFTLFFVLYTSFYSTANAAVPVFYHHPDNPTLYSQDAQTVCLAISTQSISATITGRTCNLTYGNPANPSNSTFDLFLYKQCNSGVFTPYADGTCNCTPPQTFNTTTNQCENSNQCTHSDGESAGTIFIPANGGYTQCDGTCVIRPKSPLQYTNCYVDGRPYPCSSLPSKTLIQGLTTPAQYTGESCTASDKPSPPSASTPTTPGTCKLIGGYWGNVNGTDQCIANSANPNGTGSGNGPYVGSGGTTTTTTGTGATTTSTTTNPNGSTTTTTTSQGGGTTTVDVKLPEFPEMPDLCKDHPDVDACKKTTTGDAKQVNKNDFHDEKFKESDFRNAVNGFKNRVTSTGWYGGISNFFSVSISSGSCSGLTHTFNFGTASYVVDMSAIFCGIEASYMFSLLSIGVLIGASFLAFRWAFY